MPSVSLQSGHTCKGPGAGTCALCLRSWRWAGGGGGAGWRGDGRPQRGEGQDGRAPTVQEEGEGGAQLWEPGQWLPEWLAVGKVQIGPHPAGGLRPGPEGAEAPGIGPATPWVGSAGSLGLGGQAGGRCGEQVFLNPRVRGIRGRGLAGVQGAVTLCPAPTWAASAGRPGGAGWRAEQKWGHSPPASRPEGGWQCLRLMPSRAGPHSRKNPCWAARSEQL